MQEGINKRKAMPIAIEENIYIEKYLLNSLIPISLKNITMVTGVKKLIA